MEQIAVVKFGGSSFLEENFQRACRCIKNFPQAVIVVSAPLKDGPYSTDSLLKLVSNLEKNEQNHFLPIGEKIGCYIYKNELVKDHLTTILNVEELGIFIKGNSFYLKRKTINKLLETYQYVLVPGFCAIKNGKVTCTSRGGSDLSAILVAKMLGLKQVYLFKDVGGVYEVDPKIASGKLIDKISYELAMEISDKVVSKQALLLAKKEKIKINICGLDGQIGTIISSFNC